MTALGHLYVIALLGTSTYLAVRNPRRALIWGVALLPWFGLDMDVGLRVTAFQLFIVPIAAIYLFRGLPVSSAAAGLLAPLVVFVSYALAVSLVILPFLPDADVAGGALRTPIARSLVQILVQLFTVLPLLIGARVFRTQDSLIDIAGTYLSSCLLLATIGYLQMSIWYSTGENPLPIGYFDTLVTGKSDLYRSGQFQLEDILIFRMNSLGGEPKNLGQALVVAFLILIWGSYAGVKSIKGMFPVKATYLLVAIFLTQSTSALVLLVAGLLVVFALRSGLPDQLPSVRLLMVAALVALLGFAVVTYWLDLPVVDLILARTTHRFLGSEFGLLDDFDAAVVSFLADNWIALLFGVGLGNVHLFADFYLAPDVAAYAGGTSFVAKMGLLRIVSETGIIGGVLLLVFISQLLVRALRSQHRAAVTLLVIVVLAYFLVSHVALFYIVAGATIGMITHERSLVSVAPHPLPT